MQHPSPLSAPVLLLLSDGDLVDRARNGQRHAFEALVHRHHSPLRIWLSRINAEPDSVDDIAQEALLKAWRDLARWNRSGSFRSWLFGIALHTSRDAYRTSARRQLREETWFAVTTEQPANPEVTAAAMVDVDRLLSALPLNQREVVALCYGAGFSHQEAAETLNIPLGTAKSHLTRARATMMAKLSPGPLSEISNPKSEV